jgi:predicted NUDIX family NTP pyrophosphohydrolase
VISPQEDPLAAARWEFLEEIGVAPDGKFEPLGTFHQNSGKDLTVWALEGDCDPSLLHSNMFSLVWPPKSGQLTHFPEADRSGRFGRPSASVNIVKGQRPVPDHFYERHRTATELPDLGPR